MTLAEEHDDPFDAAIHGFELLGFDEAAVLEANSPAATDPGTAREALIALFQDSYARPGPEANRNTAWETIENWFLVAFPTRVIADWKLQAHKIPQKLALVLDHWGYDIDVTLPAQPDARFQSLSGEHPEAFVVTVTDTETDETVTERAVRLYPHTNERTAVLDHVAAAELSNETVLADLGLEIVGSRTPPGDHISLLLLESDRIDALEAQYGPELPLFHDDEPLIKRPLYDDDSFSDYDPDNATDHGEAFGVPEPADTFRLETAEATREYFG
jgi:hypothetical protein